MIDINIKTKVFLTASTKWSGLKNDFVVVVVVVIIVLVFVLVGHFLKNDKSLA